MSESMSAGVWSLDGRDWLGQLRWMIGKRLRTDGANEALVSIVFAPPASTVHRDLANAFAHLHLRSGQNWDLFFAGYNWSRAKVGPHGNLLHHTFSAEAFDHLADDISWRHGWYLRRAESPGDRQPWRYSGRTDLVSVMAHRAAGPDLIDWLSLRSVTVTDANDNYVTYGLGEIVEIMADWRAEPDGLADLAAGQPPQGLSLGQLAPVLAALGSAVGAGVVGSAAFELLKIIAGRH
jgi:hypothetical protein